MGWINLLMNMVRTLEMLMKVRPNFRTINLNIKRKVVGSVLVVLFHVQKWGNYRSTASTLRHSEMSTKVRLNFWKLIECFQLVGCSVSNFLY